MITSSEILETLHMIENEHLDVRTVTMGISLFDCCDPDPKVACRKIVDKICSKAKATSPASSCQAGSRRKSFFLARPSQKR